MAAARETRRGGAAEAPVLHSEAHFGAAAELRPGTGVRKNGCVSP